VQIIGVINMWSMQVAGSESLQRYGHAKALSHDTCRAKTQASVDESESDVDGIRFEGGKLSGRRRGGDGGGDGAGVVWAMARRGRISIAVSKVELGIVGLWGDSLSAT
jgi:hypothetical protein